MGKYRVILTKQEIYEVEANCMEEAENLACELEENDPYSFSGPIDKFETELIEDFSYDHLCSH